MPEEPDDLTPFTRALAGVPPDPGSLDRDALLFAAGRAAGRRGRWWPSAAVALAALSAALATALVTRPPAAVEVERVVYVPTPAPAELPGTDPVAAPEDYPVPASAPPSPGLSEALRLREGVLRDGVGALPGTPWVFSSPSPDVPTLSSLRLNALDPDGEPLR